MKIDKAKLTIVSIVFLDVLGVGLVLPILPIYIQHLTNSEVITMSFFAMYSLCGFFSAPILGALSDRYGRRPILLVSLLGTALGWLIFALGRSSLIFLSLGRIIDGITSGNIATAQSYLVDISKNEKERTSNLGMIGATFGIGFIIGPALGAALSTIALTLPFWFAAGLALANTIAAYFLLPETHTRRTARRISLNPFAGILKGFRYKKLRPLLTVWLFLMLAFSMLQTVFSLYTNIVYDLDASRNGLLLSLLGVIIALNQGFLLKNFWLKYFKEKHLEFGAVLVGVAAYLTFALNIFWLMVSALIFLAFAQALLRVITTSQISGVAPAEERGEIIGVMNSLMFVSAVIAPLIGGIALAKYESLPWLMSAGFLLITFVILVQKHKILDKEYKPVEIPF